MPPKRKQTTSRSADTGSTSGTKKVKQSDENQDTTKDVKEKPQEKTHRLLWQWQTGETEWKRFSSPSEDAINSAYDAKKTKLEVTEDGDVVVVQFAKMFCTNKSSGVKANVRSGVNVGKDAFVWQWQDIQGEQHVYSPSQMLILEDAYKRGEKEPSVLKLGVRKYTVDFHAWTLTANTSKEMKILSRVKLNLDSKTKTTKSTAKKKKLAENTETVETISYNGKRPVDTACEQKVNCAHVYYEGDIVWDVILNQTNLQYNNNKFYKIQLLEDNNRLNYSVWYRWGRVGQRGQYKLDECDSSLARAKLLFEAKFFEKTKNNWFELDKFEKVQGKYDILYLDYSSNEDMTKKDERKPKPIPETKLDDRVKELIEMICNLKTMEAMVLEMKYDAKKAPLGKLTSDQIKAGYSALKVIEELINKHQFGTELVEACNNFYTRIPHSFGMKSPPLITTLPEIQQKIQLLEALGDIQIAIKLLNENPDSLLHPVDNHYKNLKCELTTLKKEEDSYKMVETYLMNTHGITHNLYSLTIEDIFECAKEGETERFVDLGNKMLLWHGSRMTNWAGILGKGLRIAPPEAPISGYMFGKGLYFADMCSKSANYCYPTASMKTGLLLLCEVSLGECVELKDANSNADKLPPGKNSVKGKGRFIPNPDGTVQLPDGVKVLCGKGFDSNFANANGYTLNYNEYIVYNVNQVRMRYLVRVKFNFKR